MRLTEAGQALLSRVSGLVHQLERSVEDVRALSDEPTGHVALGMMPTISYILAGPVARRVARDLPGVSLRIVEGYTGHLIDWLHRGEVDISLLYSAGSDLHMRVTELFFEELVLLGPLSSNLKPDKPVPVSQLGSLKLVLPSRPHGLRTVVETAAERAHTKLDVQFEADSFRVLKDLVESGLGYAVLPLSAVYRDGEMAKFRYSPLIKPKVTRHIILGLPSSRTDTRATTAVASLVLEEIAALVTSGQWKVYPAPTLVRLLSSAKRK
jgi:DNA-binding transcriptional LysR family regulator